MKQSEDNKFIPMTSISSGTGKEVREDVYYYTNQIVNVVMIGKSDNWVLIDAGMPNCGAEIQRVAEERFGEGAIPQAILLTHGHFDHVGGIVHLIESWNVPVYAHPMEFPFLTGAKDYPEPDPSAEAGLLGKISSFYPYKSTDISQALLGLPDDYTVPALPDWEWIHVPGHSPGQVAFFRKSDRTLISADAFVTVRQDSLYKVLVQSTEVNGPPRYFTTDWKAAEESVKRLEQLNPDLVIAGHGQSMEGDVLREELKNLTENFGELALPKHGKYVPGGD